MSYTENFILPEYYLIFACKCGACRNTCCGGWGISLTMNEYFRLLGLECSAELRSKLDTAFHLADERSPEHYALVTPRFDGHCKIQAEDGRCMLHRECGEEVLSAVCRYYPRAPRTYPIAECCTSASCEETLELLFADDEPIKFVNAELTFDLERQPEPEIGGEGYIDPEKYNEIRKTAFGILGDRALPFGQRLKQLGHELYRLDRLKYSDADASTPSPLTLTDRLCDLLGRTSETIAELKSNCAQFEYNHNYLPEQYPKLDIYLEKLFCNHIFYKRFPYSFENVTDHHLRDEFTSLAAAYALWKYLCGAYLHCRANPTLSDLIDVTALIFRVIEHSRFDECAVRFLHGSGADTPASLSGLIDF